MLATASAWWRASASCSPRATSCWAGPRSLAHAHARTGDEVAIASYLDDGHAFEDAMWEFARAYADQNEADYQAFIESEEVSDALRADEAPSPAPDRG